MRAPLRCPTFRTERSLMRQRVLTPECRRSQSGHESGPSGSGEFQFEAEVAMPTARAVGFCFLVLVCGSTPGGVIQPGNDVTVAGFSLVTRLPEVSLIFLLCLPDNPQLTRSVHLAKL